MENLETKLDRLIQTTQKLKKVLAKTIAPLAPLSVEEENVLLVHERKWIMDRIYLANDSLDGGEYEEANEIITEILS